MHKDIESQIAARIRWAYDDGCPVASHDKIISAKMANVARRRWHTYPRRNYSTPDTIDNRINDLAKGLAEKFEQGGYETAGPLISDYRWLCEQIAPLLSSRT